ncbi:MAG: PSS-domain-containing protein [Monoraphidium minutum]|nr:MAG: PSS-domain-containing protein [Monoraphidium minutum]
MPPARRRAPPRGSGPSAPGSPRRAELTEPHPALQQLDPSTAFLYAPHTVSVLLAGLLLLAYHGRVLSPPLPLGAAAGGGSGRDGGADALWSRGDAAKGVWAAVFVFLGYSTVQGPRTSMARPHPAVWRLVHGVLVAYLLLLVFLLFQSVDDARLFLRHLSPPLGRPMVHRSYAGDCRLYVRGAGLNWAALRGTLLDEFVIAHTLGWWAKALVLRNRLLLWVASVGFELMELTFRHFLPNFNECWWDSLILDVLVCNYIGISAGMATVQWFDSKYKRYNWQGLSQLDGLGAKARRSVAQLLPYSWTRFEWMVFQSPKRFLQALLPVAVMLTFELNVFFLKFALWVPPTNPLNTYRLLLWFLCALPAAREYWEFIEGRSGEAAAYGTGPAAARFSKLGTFAWLAIAMTALETMLSVKFGAGLYTQPWPPLVKVAWAAAASALVGALAGWQLSLWRRRRQEEGQQEEEEAQQPQPQPPLLQQQQQQQQSPIAGAPRASPAPRRRGRSAAAGRAPAAEGEGGG